jgi:hypothetical protein
MKKTNISLNTLFGLLQHLLDSDREQHEKLADIDQKLTHLIEHKRTPARKRLDSKLSDFKN